MIRLFASVGDRNVPQANIDVKQLAVIAKPKNEYCYLLCNDGCGFNNFNPCHYH